VTEAVDPVGGAHPLRDTLSQLRLRELLAEVQERITQIVEGRDRLDGLVEAMLVVTSDLDLDTTQSSSSTLGTGHWASGGVDTTCSRSSTRESMKTSASGSGTCPRAAACSEY
jgi:hypothetical protein